MEPLGASAIRPCSPLNPYAGVAVKEGVEESESTDEQVNSVSLKPAILGSSSNLEDLTPLHIKMNLMESELVKELDDWINDPSVSGKKQDAKERILTAFKKRQSLLDLSDLDLNQPPHFSRLPQLSFVEELFLQFNKFTTLPEDFLKNFPSLKGLKLFCNNISSLPEKIFCSSPNLTAIRLGKNKLSSLPKKIFHPCRDLAILSLNENGISSLDEDLLSCNFKLSHLLLCNNSLTSLPKKIFHLCHALNHVSLNENQLSSLNEDLFHHCPELEEFYVYNNQLKAIPENFFLYSFKLKNITLTKNPIASLSKNLLFSCHQLTSLYLSDMKLSSLDEEFLSLCPQLSVFDLDANKFTSLPPKIFSYCPKLKIITLSENQFSTLPQELFSYSPELEMVHLNDNQLTSLPDPFLPNTGTPPALSILDLRNNPHLSSLPSQFENIGFRRISYENTSLPETLMNRILANSEAIRAANQIKKFPDCLKFWGDRSKKTWDFSPLLQLEESKQNTLYLWLTKLSQIRDFQNDKSQKALAIVVCEMLEDILKNSEFSEFFFYQVNTNLENCHERASGALNELYTSWKIFRLSEETPLKEKLQLLERGAKTIALRHTLIHLIENYEKTNGLIVRESVHIFLYWEVYLKEKFQLLTIIEETVGANIGKVSWIQQEFLEEAIEGTYLNHLLAHPLFEKLAREDRDYQEAYQKEIVPFEEKLEISESQAQQEIEEKETLAIINTLAAERKLILRQIQIDWFNQKKK